MTMSLTQPLRRAAQQKGDAVAMVFGERLTTFEALEEFAARCGSVLKGAGLKPGDRVGLIAGQSDRFAAMLYGVWWAGGALVECGVRLLLVDGDGAILGAKLTDLRPDGLRVLLPEALETAMASATPVEDAGVGGDALAGIFFTQGIVGPAKGVPLTHANLYSNILGWLAEGEVTDTSRALIGWPLSHATGLLWFLAQMHLGGLCILPSDPDPATWPALAARQQATHALLSTALLQQALTQAAAPSGGLGRLRAVVYGGAPISEAVLTRAMELLPSARFLQTFSTTEAGAAALVLTAWHHTREGRASGKLRSAGRAGLNCEIRVVDDDGQVMPALSPGALQVRGAGVSTGYWNACIPESRASTGGWVATGDRAWLDEDGYAYLLGRVDNDRPALARSVGP
jgi:acyl-CoA synthetase (AMP-forming)/AMP-acid ligase II